MILKLAVGKKIYKVKCQESEKEKLIKIAKIVNRKLNLLAMNMKDSDEKTIMFMTALMIQEELEQEKDHNAAISNNISDDDLYDAMCNNIKNITNYVKSLTKTIKDY